MVLLKEQQLCNLEIAYELLDFILEHPEVRFEQVLWALKLVDSSDRFFEPSKVTLDRLRNYKEGLSKGV